MLLMSRNAISANPEHYLFKIFRGNMPPDPPEGLKKFSRCCVAGKICLGLTPPPLPPSPNKKSQIEPCICICFDDRLHEKVSAALQHIHRFPPACGVGAPRTAQDPMNQEDTQDHTQSIQANPETVTPTTPKNASAR